MKQEHWHELHPYWRLHAGDYYVTSNPELTLRVNSYGMITHYNNIHAITEEPTLQSFLFRAGICNQLHLHGNAVESEALAPA